jgi:hypothetical protein
MNERYFASWHDAMATLVFNALGSNCFNSISNLSPKPGVVEGPPLITMLDNNVLRKAAGTRDNDTRIPFCNERQLVLPNMAGLNHGSLMLMLRLKEWGWVSKAVAKDDT